MAVTSLLASVVVLLTTTGQWSLVTCQGAATLRLQAHTERADSAAHLGRTAHPSAPRFLYRNHNKHCDLRGGGDLEARGQQGFTS